MTSEDLIQVTIDGLEVSVPKGTLVVEAARQLGIEIPVYCYHPKMKPVGACRVCAVEVLGQRRPIMTACTTEVMPNMEVHTRSENAIAAREGILEFLLINHPLDCPVCDRGGECDLQDFTLRYGPSTTRFVEAKRHFAKSKQVGQNVILDRERCIMCQRCVRFCSEIAMEEGLVIVDRGYRSEIGTFEGRSFDSQYSGNTIELCPVGALTAKTYRFNARPWEQQHYAGVCNHCSVGCNITVDVRFDEVVRFRSRCNDEIDDGWLCDKGRYGHDHIHADNRLMAPMLRNQSGELEPITWPKALTLAAEKLKEAGSKSSVVLGSQLSLEDGHSLLRLARGVLKTGNIAHRHSDEAVLEVPLDDHASGRIFGCDKAEIIVCLGSHPWATHSGVDLRIKKGLRHGAKLVSLNNSEVMTGLADFQSVGEPSALWDRLLKAIDSLPEAGPTGLKVPAPRPWEAGGSTSQDWDKMVELFRNKTRVMVIAAGNLAEQGLKGLSASIQARGWATAPHGLLHLRHGANALGLDQAGCLPTAGPGSSKLDDNKPYREAWGEFASSKGQSYSEMVKTGVGVMLAVGCDPLSEIGAKKAPFLIACSSLPNATTEKADLILPLSTSVESHGVFVSTDGTVQLSRQSIMPVGQSQPGWAIASALVKALTEGEAPYKTSRQVFTDLGELNPALRGRTYRDFEAQGEQHWSYPQQADLGMPRPDLSAIPVHRPDTPMWMPVVNTGSKVEAAGRLSRGDRPPSAPGQDDPRRIAALLGLAQGYGARESEELIAPTSPAKEGYVPLRVVPTSSAQPAGPTPAKRHQKIGVSAHVSVALPVSAVAALTEGAVTPEADTEIVVAENPPETASATPGHESTAHDKKEDSGQGDSNVATVDEVTEDEAALEIADQDEAKDDQKAVPPDPVADLSAAVAPTPPLDSAGTAANQAEPVPQAIDTPPDSDVAVSSKAEGKKSGSKKGKRKGSKEKKS